LPSMSITCFAPLVATAKTLIVYAITCPLVKPKPRLKLVEFWDLEASADFSLPV